MTTIYKLTQLAKSQSGEVLWAGVEHLNYPEEKIDVMLDMPLQARNELWGFVKGNWNEPKYATVVHDAIESDGYTPINGKVVHVDLQPIIFEPGFLPIKHD